MTIQKTIKFILHTAKIETMDRLDNALAFGFIALGVIVRMAVTLVFFQSLYLQVDQLGGWEISQVYVLLGTYFLINSVAWSSYQRGFNRLPRFIENGDLDLLLSKPINIRNFLVYRYVDILFSIPQTAAAIGLIVYGAVQGASINIPLYLIALICALVIHYAVTVMLYSINFFYIIKSAGYLSMEVFKMGQYPITLYKGFVKLVLSVIIPLAFIYSVPAGALFGNVSGGDILMSLLMAFVFLFISKYFFDFSLKHYESAQG